MVPVVVRRQDAWSGTAGAGPHTAQETFEIEGSGVAGACGRHRRRTVQDPFEIEGSCRLQPPARHLHPDATKSAHQRTDMLPQGAAPTRPVRIGP
jgi:hypothetical protein